MSEYLLQAKGVEGIVQQSFTVEDDDNTEVEKRAIEVFFSKCNEDNKVLGLGMMQILNNGNFVMGTYFNHFGKECITYLRQADYNILTIISTGNVVIGGTIDNQLKLEDFCDLEDILRFCNSGRLIAYDQNKFGVPLYDALMSIHTDGELVAPVQAIDVF